MFVACEGPRSCWLRRSRMCRVARWFRAAKTNERFVLRRAKYKEHSAPPEPDTAFPRVATNIGPLRGLRSLPENPRKPRRFRLLAVGLVGGCPGNDQFDFGAG